MSNLIKWRIEDDKTQYVFGTKGSEICSEGNPIMDETSCREACRRLNVPQEKILGSFYCYKDGQGNCYQDDQHGPGASLICKRSEQIEGGFCKDTQNLCSCSRL